MSLRENLQEAFFLVDSLTAGMTFSLAHLRTVSGSTCRFCASCLTVSICDIFFCTWTAFCSFFERFVFAKYFGLVRQAKVWRTICSRVALLVRHVRVTFSFNKDQQQLPQRAGLSVVRSFSSFVRSTFTEVRTQSPSIQRTMSGSRAFINFPLDRVSG